jgi:hypothetical protein
VATFDFRERYDTYLRAASSADAAERIELLRRCVVDDFEIISPFPYAVRGIEAVAVKLGEVAASMPDGRLRLRRITEIDRHNDLFRVAYANKSSAGETLSTGLHVAETRDGLIARLLVFVPADLTIQPV